MSRPDPATMQPFQKYEVHLKGGTQAITTGAYIRNFHHVKFSKKCADLATTHACQFWLPWPCRCSSPAPGCAQPVAPSVLHIATQSLVSQSVNYTLCHLGLTRCHVRPAIICLKACTVLEHFRWEHSNTTDPQLNKQSTILQRWTVSDSVAELTPSSVRTCLHRIFLHYVPTLQYVIKKTVFIIKDYTLIT